MSGPAWAGVAVFVILVGYFVVSEVRFRRRWAAREAAFRDAGSSDFDRQP